MTKLIGTGKDVRFPAGQDYDVHEDDVERHVAAGLGEPVEPGAEAYASHRGYDLIAEDAGEGTNAGGPVIQDNYGFTSRVAARVETTSTEGSGIASPEAAVAAARAAAPEVESRGDVALPSAELDPTSTEGLEGDPDAARGDEGGPLPGQGGRGAVAAREAGEDPGDAPRSEGGIEGDPGSADREGSGDASEE